MSIKLVSANTIKLPNNASAVNNYYTGYNIVLTRLNAVTGKETTQKHLIVAYSGSTRVATIDGIWDPTFTPASGDTFKIVPRYPDSRVSINPAIQTLDYITSKRYGRGLDVHKDLRLPTWTESARTCDARSAVTVQVNNYSGSINVGDVYRYPASGSLIWQGTVLAKEGNYITFTDCIGKLTNKWNNWNGFYLQELIYQDNRLYVVTSPGTKPNKPVHGSGTVEGLQLLTYVALTKSSGTGNVASLSLVVDGNPIRALRNGVEISGYSLYDSDGVDYWRLLGWNSPGQREVTRHQCNITIDTSLPLFDNMNSLLEHYGGILRYSQGKYELEVEEAEGQISNDPNEVRNITADHIIGKIKLTDEGIRSAYNSLTVGYADPANKYESRNISFFNSEFLKSDRNVPKKGNIAIPGITNYYNARLLADKYLTKSRYGTTINMNLAPRGLLLVAGRVIQVQYPRYGWVNKKFRIENLTHNEDTTVDIVAEEYDDKFYVISKISKPPAVGLGGDSTITTISGPNGLIATSIESNNEGIMGIELKWTDNINVNATNITTEIFASPSSRLYLNIIDIDSESVITTSESHGLKSGDLITSLSGYNGLETNKSYYVNKVADNKFTVSEEKGGIITTLVAGTDLLLLLLTANIVGTVTPPENTYIDMYSGNSNNIVTKYYWIRYKTIQE